MCRTFSIGGASGKLKGGRHLAFPTRTVPTGNLLLSVLDMFGVHQDKLGDSTGRLTDSCESHVGGAPREATGLVTGRASQVDWSTVR